MRQVFVFSERAPCGPDLAGLLHPAGLAALATLPLAMRVDRMLRTTKSWEELHDRGGAVRLFYLANGLVSIIVTAWL